MTAKDLIANNTLKDQPSGEEIVFAPIAITAINMATIQTKEKAAEAFCEVYNKDCIQCKLGNQTDFGCRDTCPAFEQFIEIINR